MLGANRAAIAGLRYDADDAGRRLMQEGLVVASRRAAIFVLSDVRSGSTLLDLCLGAHPAIMSLGEVHWLAAYISRDRSVYDPDHPLVCSCGEHIDECPFWLQVALRLPRPIGSLRLRGEIKPTGTARAHENVLRKLARRVLRRAPRLLRNPHTRTFFRGDELARDISLLFDAVAEVSGRPYCVDSSKSSFRFRAVYESDPQRSLALVLARDYRAVVYSKMKRGVGMERAAVGWRRKMEEIDVLTRDLPSPAVYSLKYEDLCSDPALHLASVSEFIGIPFDAAMIERSTTGVHHIGGSPSKFDESRSKILLDRSFERRFSAHQESALRRLVGPIAERWGY